MTTNIGAKLYGQSMAMYTNVDVAKFILADFDDSCHTYDVHLRVFSDGGEDLFATKSTILTPQDIEIPYYDRPKPADQVGWYEIGQVILENVPGHISTCKQIVGQLNALLVRHKNRKKNEKSTYFTHGI